jgi:hypothetical protein
MMRHLRAEPLVRSARFNSAAGCLVFEHDQDDPATLMAVVRNSMRGWEQASNGEAVLVSLDIHEDAQCRSARDVLGHSA